MRRTFLATLLLAAFAGPALAQSTLVRTGEHPDFTRIVVDFRDRPEWRLERVEDGVRLVAGRTDFDLSQAYGRIARDRVAALSQEGAGVLRITLGCRCKVEPIELSNGGLVLDVSAGDPVTPFRQAIDLPGHDGLEPLPLRLVPRGLVRPDGEGELPSPERLARAGRLRAAVSEQFARGAAQGVVDAERLPATRPPAPPAAPPETPAEEPVDPAFPNIRIETQIDRDNPGRAPRGNDLACYGAPDLDLAAWGAPEMLTRGLGDLWLRQADAAGAAQAEAQGELARALIYTTFGAEARAVLRGAPSDLPQLAILREMASLMDAPVAAPHVAALRDCAPAAAILTMVSSEPELPADLRPMAAAFSALPVHLRRHLGPRLAEALVEAHRVEEALGIRGAIERGGPPPAIETGIVDAKIDRARDVPGDGMGDLLPVVEGRTPRAAEALTLLLDTARETGREVPKATLDQAIALGFESRGPEGLALDTALLRTFLATGAFQDAAFRLDSLDARPGADMAALGAEFFAAIAAIDDPARFLTMASRFVTREVPGPGLRLALARRLEAEGLDDLAKRYLDQAKGIPAADERLLRARLAVNAGEADIAESYLAGLDGDEAEALRGEIASLRAGASAPGDPVVAAVPFAASDLQTRNRALLERSAAMRAEFRDLLAE